MDEIFGIYSAALPARAGVGRRAATRPPRGESPQAHERAIKAKALDLLRGLLPAASLSHMGIFATGQTYEQLILHLLAHPLPEARHYGRDDPRGRPGVMPSFVSRVERPDRGGEWVAYLAAPRAGRRALGRAARASTARPATTAPAGRRCASTHHDGDEDLLLAALLFEAVGDRRARDARRRSRSCSTTSARRAARRPHGRARQPPPPPRPRPGGAALPLRDRQRTTAPSATCSATACSPASGRR